MDYVGAVVTVIGFVAILGLYLFYTACKARKTETKARIWRRLLKERLKTLCAIAFVARNVLTSYRRERCQGSVYSFLKLRQPESCRFLFYFYNNGHESRKA